MKNQTWLVRRYRRELHWDRRTYQEKEELREILRVTTRGIQFACVKMIVRRLNELAIHFRDNKPSIDNLRLQLMIVCFAGNPPTSLLDQFGVWWGEQDFVSRKILNLHAPGKQQIRPRINLKNDEPVLYSVSSFLRGES